MNLNELDAIVFDFDGVLTDNSVFVNEQGLEWVRCSRADGLAFDVLRKVELAAYIVSTEKNPVVAARAKKLGVPVYQGVKDKVEMIKKIAAEQRYSLRRLFYIGNDLNDYKAMRLCGYSACPCDSHPAIRELATYPLKAVGGAGVARELVEEILAIDVLDTLYGDI